MLGDGESQRLDVRLRATAFAMDPMAVTGTKKETYVSESPAKVDVVTARHLERSGAKDLMESLQTVSGLYQQVHCGVCYPNSICINGMEGPYTAVLIDGMPIMGALASVYRLNGINTASIERLRDSLAGSGVAFLLISPEAPAPVRRFLDAYGNSFDR